MGLVKYQQKDIMPFVFVVLMDVSNDLLFLLTDRIIYKYYPDLQQLADRADINDSTLQVIDRTTDPLTRIVVDRLQEIRLYLESRMNLYGCTMIGLLEDEELDEKLDDLMDDVKAYLTSNIPDYFKLANLHASISAAAHICWCLCLVMLHGELDAANSFDARGCYDPSLPVFEDMLCSADDDIRLLAGVGNSFNRLYVEFAELAYETDSDW